MKKYNIMCAKCKHKFTWDEKINGCPKCGSMNGYYSGHPVCLRSTKETQKMAKDRKE